MPLYADPIAYPPRGLSREEAARYVGVGVDLFDQMVADRRMPKPKRVNRRVVWDRVALDMAFSALPGDEEKNFFDAILARRSST
jgi:predicted DNA-binding transcriptional regulator AlpA